MLKKLWLVLAASAVVAAGQVVAEGTEDVAVQTEQEVVLTAEETAQAMLLAQAIIDGDITAADLPTVTALQENRTKRSQVIKTVVYTGIGLAAAAGAGYLAYNYWNKEAVKKEDEEVTRGGKKLTAEEAAADVEKATAELAKLEKAAKNKKLTAKAKKAAEEAVEAAREAVKAAEEVAIEAAKPVKAKAKGKKVAEEVAEEEVAGDVDEEKILCSECSHDHADDEESEEVVAPVKGKKAAAKAKSKK